MFCHHEHGLWMVSELPQLIVFLCKVSIVMVSLQSDRNPKIPPKILFFKKEKIQILKTWHLFSNCWAFTEKELPLVIISLMIIITLWLQETSMTSKRQKPVQNPTESLSWDQAENSGNPCRTVSMMQDSAVRSAHIPSRDIIHEAGMQLTSQQGKGPKGPCHSGGRQINPRKILQLWSHQTYPERPGKSNLVK